MLKAPGFSNLIKAPAGLLCPLDSVMVLDDTTILGKIELAVVIESIARQQYSEGPDHFTPTKLICVITHSLHWNPFRVSPGKLFPGA